MCLEACCVSIESVNNKYLEVRATYADVAHLTSQWPARAPHSRPPCNMSTDDRYKTYHFFIFITLSYSLILSDSTHKTH